MLGAGKRAALAKRVVPATRVASPPGISQSVGNKNSSESLRESRKEGGLSQRPSHQVSQIVWIRGVTQAPPYPGREENIGEMLHDNLGKNFLDKLSKIQKTKAKIYRLHQTKKLLHIKGSNLQTEETTSEKWEKISANYTSNKRLLCRIYKEFKPLNRKKKIIQLKMGKRSKQIFFKRHTNGQLLSIHGFCIHTFNKPVHQKYSKTRLGEWLPAVIPALWEAKAGRSLKVKDKVSLCSPGWRAVMQSLLTAASISQAQVILPLQLPKQLGPQRGGLTMFSRVVSNSWTQRKEPDSGQVRWLTPVIPALRDTKVGASPEVRSSRPALTTWYGSISSRVLWLKPVIPALWEVKVGGSQGQEIKTILVNAVSTKTTKLAERALWEAEASGSQGQEIDTILANMCKVSSIVKINFNNEEV
ncbi:putative uncharacterized protein C8orf44 [Plecturocebus cupreus]